MRLQDVWFRYGRRAPWALCGVDVAIRPGETVVVLGRNGAGKSTLLQLAAGVLRPSRGAVRDRPAVVGWVPERFPADQPFTTGQYLHAMAALRGEGAVEAWLERLGLTAYRNVRLPELSKGTAQKVGLAQALLVAPGLLVLDEPWEGLDAHARELVPDIVAEVTGAGGAVLVSDHRAEVARLPAARRWLVDGGTVTVDGGPASRSGTDDGHGHPDSGPHWVVEVAVSAADPASAAQRLRADGHEVLAVRSAERQDRR